MKGVNQNHRGEAKKGGGRRTCLVMAAVGCAAVLLVLLLGVCGLVGLGWYAEAGLQKERDEQAQWLEDHYDGLARFLEFPDDAEQAAQESVKAMADQIRKGEFSLDPAEERDRADLETLDNVYLVKGIETRYVKHSGLDPERRKELIDLVQRFLVALARGCVPLHELDEIRWHMGIKGFSPKDDPSQALPQKLDDKTILAVSEKMQELLDEAGCKDEAAGDPFAEVVDQYLETLRSGARARKEMQDDLLDDLFDD